MPELKVVGWIRDKYLSLSEELDERGRRRWAAAEARSLGRGGISAVALATGISDRTIRNGLAELARPEVLPSDRQRRSGAGRRRREVEQPKLLTALKSLVEPSTRGDPMSRLRWTCKSTRSISIELGLRGYLVSSTKVGALLKAQGYSLQANRKTIEGKQHPDRNAQFEYINRRVKSVQKSGAPAISVDTKKKEPLGKLRNAGRTYRRKGDPASVKTHDFPDNQLGKAIPYGIYDIGRNEAGVSIGISSDTAEFAVASIRKWWQKMGLKRYRKARRLLVTADCGGSNNPRTRLWQIALQRFANESGLIIEICHYPPGTSKWNKIEHRLFCHITRNWQGVPLETLEIVVNLIGATKTREGLEVHAWIDSRKYEKGIKVTEEELKDVQIKRRKFHGEWNYEICPQKSRP
jgi:hypothetical protein